MHTLTKLKEWRRLLPLILIPLTLLLSLPAVGQSLFQDAQNSRSAPRAIGLDPNQLLKPTEAFKPALHLKSIEEGEITLLWDIHPDYYLYKNKIDISLLNANAELISLDLPPGKEHTDEFFGKQEIYDEPQIFTLQLENIEALNRAHIHIEAQGCAKSGFCFAPQTWELSTLINPDIDPANDPLKTETAEIAPPSLSEHDRLTQYLLDNRYLAIPLFFLLGLLLSFTPCVLPMLPILSGILTGQGNLSVRKGFTISLVYVLSMGLIYTLLGLLAAFLGKGLASYLQHSYVLIGFGAIFVILSLSMFGVYQLQMPSFIQSRLSNISNQQSGRNNYIGVAIMGMLSALIVGPCVTAPLIGIIGLVAQSQDYLLGGITLFSMSMGMGVPLLILGASSGHLLPKAGAWMDHVKTLFGFMLLGLAAYFIGRTLPQFWEQTLYAVISLATFIWLIIALTENKSGRLFFGLLALLTLGFGIHSIQEAKRPIETALFTNIKGISGLNSALETHRGEVVMLEFNADWCVACKEMEKHVFSDPTVRNKMGEMALLMSDVTKNDKEDQRLQEHFTIYGPPAILFFDKEGQELSDFRVMGSVSKEEFLQHIEYLLEHYR